MSRWIALLCYGCAIIILVLVIFGCARRYDEVPGRGLSEVVRQIDNVRKP